MLYRVLLQGSSDRQVFSFENYDDALEFASMAMDHGTFRDFHYEAEGDDPFARKVDDEPKPLIVSMMGVEV